MWPNKGLVVWLQRWQGLERGARWLMGENLKVVWAEFLIFKLGHFTS
jgi:hypothetical protein